MSHHSVPLHTQMTKTLWDRFGFPSCTLPPFVPQKALHLRATRTFEDVQGHVRRTGEEWLVTQEQSEAYVPDVFEEVVAEVLVTTLGPRQYCVVLDPVGPNGQPQLGQQRVVKVHTSWDHRDVTCRSLRTSWVPQGTI